MLSCQGLTLTYPDGDATRTVLDHVDLTIERGECAVLLGPSGSGKSSLIYLLSCLRAPTAGQVFLGDVCISGQCPNDIADIRRTRFAFVFQMHFLMPYLTAVENVMTGSGDFSKDGRANAADLLSQLGLANHVNKFTHQMSGGERQRVAVARALISQPEVIFADEPTASLDHDTAVAVFALLKTHQPNTTLVMATHDRSILSGDERTVRLTGGRTAG